MLIRPALREYRTWNLDSRHWDAYQPRPGDIIIGTSSKAGTTWMQQIVGSLVFQDSIARAIPTVSPWIDVRFRSSAEEMHRVIAMQTHRRFLKTHLPADGLPLHDDVRYVHVARDGRDATLSYHNQVFGHSPEHLARLDKIGLEDPAIGKPYPRPPQDPAVFFRDWVSDAVIAGQSDGYPSLSFFDLEASYWTERQRENFLLVHYNDLLEDLDSEMRRIAAFLDIPVDEALWPSLVQAASFERMREAGDTLMPHIGRQFFNRGRSGGWRDVLTPDDVARYTAKVREKFTLALAAWVEGGRRGAGDPRDAPD